MNKHEKLMKAQGLTLRQVWKMDGLSPLQRSYLTAAMMGGSYEPTCGREYTLKKVQEGKRVPVEAQPVQVSGRESAVMFDRI